MDTNLLDIKFARIGARLKVADRPSHRRTSGAISLDVQADRKGEFFEIARPAAGEADVSVLDVRPADRHLLLLVRGSGTRASSSAATTSATGSLLAFPKRLRSARFVRPRKP